MIKNDKESINYTSVFVVLSTLFFMWGLVTVLNFMLVGKFMQVFSLSILQAHLLNVAFFGTYFLFSIPAGKIINKLGFRKGIVTGAIISGIGCLLFYPAAGQQSYEFLIFAIFVMASGFTILQVGANPYVVLLGTRGKGASKLSLVGGFNSLGTVLAPLFATGIFLRIAGLHENWESTLAPEEIKTALVNYVQTPYLGLGIIWFLLAILIAFSNLPKVTTKDVEPLVKENTSPRKHVWEFSHLIFGTLAIFAYVGSEVAIANYIGQNAEKLVALYWGGLMIGRFIGAGLLTKVGPRTLITICTSLSIIFIIIYLIKYNPVQNFVLGTVNSCDSILYLLVVIGLFNSILWPCIFTLAIDGLGKFSEEGSSSLIMGILGGAIIPFVFVNISVISAFVIIAICYLYIAFFGFKGSRYEKRTNFY